MPDLVSWSTFGLVLLIYGLAPGAFLRVICLAFHRDDARRQELRAELNAVPHPLRPLWVAEQLEVALFDGVGERLRWAAPGRIIHRWQLHSDVEFNRRSPDTFSIPGDREKERIGLGDTVKLMFHMRDGWGERMWVDVIAVKRNGKLVGVLSNQPVGIPRLETGKKIKFHRDHIIDIQTGDVEDSTVSLEPDEDGNVPIWCACCNGHSPRAGLSGPETAPSARRAAPPLCQAHGLSRGSSSADALPDRHRIRRQGITSGRATSSAPKPRGKAGTRRTLRALREGLGPNIELVDADREVDALERSRAAVTRVRRVAAEAAAASQGCGSHRSAFDPPRYRDIVLISRTSRKVAARGRQRIFC